MATVEETKTNDKMSNSSKGKQTRTRSHAGSRSGYRPGHRSQASGYITQAEKSMMEHRAHTTLTQLPHIPQKFMFTARQSAFNRNTRARTRSKAGPSTPDAAFTPRVTVGGTATDAATAESDHFTPDWFKMSIRTVDRDNVMKADVE